MIRRGGGTGLRSALLPLVSARGGGAGCRSPPPPPPPPGPGVGRNTSRVWVGSRLVSSGALATPIVVNTTSPASSAACSAPEAANARAGDRLAAARRPEERRRPASGAPPGAGARPGRPRPPPTNRPSTVSSSADWISARTSRGPTPAARAISRAREYVRDGRGGRKHGSSRVEGAKSLPRRRRAEDGSGPVFGRYRAKPVAGPPHGLCSARDSGA